ncbi:DegT/DnrJ/EryC1/StrS family aminotransferase [Enterovibrio norvegicus]|uniref:dTDP-4-amino-4,6-dideoxygalactose transaminase n=1 Tax=Enterovibrio norvegicus DSM 15893 TaxID=1121869 RepID=A0A1I5N8Q5_9GAMM|nr:DegT/DnrJ/EryC1/StrS family aminotransferase [Enterovibrio norvegicus]SFP18094.1 dTDP-4-amino-4,6-dideoxygalactose transaminase [Enterovibrio norvegicus DSM 15893]
MQFIDLESQYKHLKEKIDARIHKVLDHGAYIMGPEVFELEDMLAEYVGVKHAITCANGTDALTLAMMALDIKEGDAVFCPTFTFFATAETVAFARATPIFVDSDASTFNICPEDLERKIEKVIKEGKLNATVIIAVDLFGLPANYPQIEKIAKKYSLKIIEDTAQGFGGTIEGKKAGSFGDIATTSFFPAKPLGCYGDGGAIFTNNDEYAELIRSYRVHGKGSDKYDNVRIGVNSRLDTIQAAILIEKLKIFPDELIKRNELASHYSVKYKDKWIVPTIPEGYTSSWAQYTVRSNSRESDMKMLGEQGIPTMVYYRTCMHKQTAFSHFQIEEFPVADDLSETVFSLPMHAYMTLD